MTEGNLDDLIGIAEIATVFIGFAALTSVLSRRTANRIIIVGIVFGAPMVLIACLLPILLRSTGMGTGDVLRLSSVLFMLINLAGTIAMFRSVPGFSRYQREESTGLVWAMEAVVYVLLILCASGAWEAYTFTFYLGGVLTLLLQIIVLFMALIISLSQEPESPDGG